LAKVKLPASFLVEERETITEFLEPLAGAN
jgi:hypothetical protein